MVDPKSKILAAQFEAANEYLTWIHGEDCPVATFGDDIGKPYPYWLLVENKTDRVLVMIDGPHTHQLCWDVKWDGGQRIFISLEGAKRWALEFAFHALGMAQQQKA